MYENQAAAAVAPYGAPVDKSSIAALAEQIAKATGRLNSLVSQVNHVSIGIHGQRPQEVPATTGTLTGNPQNMSLRARVEDLYSEISMLESAVAQLTR